MMKIMIVLLLAVILAAIVEGNKPIQYTIYIIQS